MVASLLLPTWPPVTLVGGGAFSLRLGGVKVLTLQGGGAPPGGSESPGFPCGPYGDGHSSFPLGPDQHHPTGVGGVQPGS